MGMCEGCASHNKRWNAIGCKYSNWCDSVGSKLSLKYADIPALYLCPPLRAKLEEALSLMRDDVMHDECYGCRNYSEEPCIINSGCGCYKKAMAILKEVLGDGNM